MMMVVPKKTQTTVPGPSGFQLAHFADGTVETTELANVLDAPTLPVDVQVQKTNQLPRKP